MSSCGQRMDDEAVRVAVGLRLGARLCELHQCLYAAPIKVGSEGTHGLVCRRSAGRTTLHHVLKDLVWRAPTYLQSTNRVVFWGQTESVSDRMMLANVWPGTSSTYAVHVTCYALVCPFYLSCHNRWSRYWRRSRPEGAEIPVDIPHTHTFPWVSKR